MTLSIMTKCSDECCNLGYYDECHYGQCRKALLTLKPHNIRQNVIEAKKVSLKSVPRLLVENNLAKRHLVKMTTG